MSVSLTSSVKTCRFDTADAARMESDRFLSSDNALCPTWRGVDTAGRTVHRDTYYTKAPGCRYAGTRIGVENDLRPQYSSFITLDPSDGIHGNLYGDNAMVRQKSLAAREELDDVHARTGMFGQQYRANIHPGCSLSPHSDAAALSAHASRQGHAKVAAARACRSLRDAGM